MKTNIVTEIKNIGKWLLYYKNCLADADRKEIKVASDSLLVQSYNLCEVPKQHAQYLWKISQADKTTVSVPVDISPCLYMYEYEHGKTKDKTLKAVHPFWIPATMTKDGKLEPAGVPFFVRDYLEPNPPGYYKISTIKKVDDSLPRFDFTTTDWKKYWHECEMFFKAITNKDFETFNLKIERKIHILKGETRNTSFHVLKLYNNIQDSGIQHILINKLLKIESVDDTNPPSPIDCVFNINHVGQMNEEFPLSVSQRQAIRAYTNSRKGEIIAINGPPGTGKTTLLQSVIANSVVRSVALNKPPELIMACSTNNQAITNILKSLALKSTSHLTNHWLPEVQSLGLYFTKNLDSDYQICTSEFGDGFILDYENTDPLPKKQYFLEMYARHFDTATSIEICKDKLQLEVKSKVHDIERHLLVAKNYEESQTYLQALGYSSITELQNKINDLLPLIDDIELNIKKIQLAEKELKKAKDTQQLSDKFFSFSSAAKERRAAIFQRILLDIKLGTNIDFSDYGHLCHLINNRVIEFSNLKLAWTEKKIDLEKHLQNIKSNIFQYSDIIKSWDEKYSAKLNNLYKKTKEEYRNLNPIEDMSIRLDISYRSEAFWLAIHYREAEYLLLLQTAIKNKKLIGKERKQVAYKQKLQRIACITPVFIATFATLPRYATFYEDHEEFRYFNLFDLLIADEAGQVSPEISIPSFSLAQKAIVVGDICQIEPVWPVIEKVDVINLQSNQLIPAKSYESELKILKDLGKLCSSGSLMKLAQNACIYSNAEQRGILLVEHRRCLDSIISYSNTYIYNNQLLPKIGDVHNIDHPLPSKGFLHINSKSKPDGSSQINLLDAKVIAKWIDEKREVLEVAYGKKIHKILSVITPYKSQVYTIKKELEAIDKMVYADLIIGTVHVIQGAEIEIVIFSTVLSTGNETKYLDNINLLNVAVSRAKHSFLVFGNMNLLDASMNNPLGNLKKWLLEKECCELSNQITFELIDVHDDTVRRINTLKHHTGTLRRAFEVAKSELIIVSPYISIVAIESDDIISMVKNTISRGVKIIVFTDSKLDVFQGKLKKNASLGRDALIQNGVILKIIDGIHNKSLIVDDDFLVEGSFNWLSAVRDEKNSFSRFETSIVLKDDQAKEPIKMAKTDLKLG